MTEPARLDAPNQQVVRADGSGPADEGAGGTTPAAKPEPEPKAKASTKKAAKDEGDGED